MTADAIDPNSDESLKAISERRIAALKGKSGGGTVAKEAKAEAGAASEGSGPKAETAGDKPVETPEGNASPNLSHIPEKYRSVIASLSPEVRDGLVEWTKGGTVRHADVMKYKTEAEEARKALEAGQAKIAAWDSFASDKRRVDALMALEKKFQKQAAEDVGAEIPEDDVPDYPNMTAKEIEAHIRKVAKQAAAEAKAEARREALEEVEAKYVTPLTRVQQANLALAQYGKENGYTAEQMQAATQKALAYASKIPGFDRNTITADNVVSFVEDFLPSLAATPPANGSHKSGAVPNDAKVATPPRTATVAPSPQPAWERDGRAPNRGERLGAIVSTIEKMYGRKTTEAEVRGTLGMG